MRFAWLVVLAGCAFMPEDAEVMQPPAEYRALWDSAQVCTGRHGRFADLRFYLVPGNSFDTPDGTAAARTQGRDIYVAEAWRDHPMVVKHEMVHALIGTGHPAHPFESPCHATWASYRGASTLAALPAGE